jgi:hypothetical protein
MQSQRASRSEADWLLSGLVVLMTLLGTGCSTVGVQEQRLVSKPNMQFSKWAVYGYSSRIIPQVQPGLAVPGAQPSVCTVCR